MTVHAPQLIRESAADSRAAMLDNARATLEEPGVSRADGKAYVVPGRIEVLGKHTDYAGGRSLLAAVERSARGCPRNRSPISSKPTPSASVSTPRCLPGTRCDPGF